MSCSSGEILDYGITPEPNQPRTQEIFPKRKFGQKNPQYRSFQSSWFDHLSWCKWLHWETNGNKAYYIICRNVHILKHLTSKNKESAFITDGFNNWKDATRAFEQHRKSTCHKEATNKWSIYLKGTNLKTQISRQLVSEKENARICLMKIFTSVEYLARQGMPLRGHQEDSGNFYQLLQLRANDSEELRYWLQKKKAYVSHEIQNDMLKIMSLQIQRAILRAVRTSVWYCVNADETVDASLTEQVIILIY